MKLQLRSRQRGDVDWELIAGVLYVPFLLIAAAGVTVLPASLVPVCRLRQTTGVPCPTCGAFRSCRLLLKGDITGALAMQPLVVGLILVGAVVALYSLVVVVGRMPRLRLVNVSVRETWCIALGIAAVCLANWVYLLAGAG